jgi:hypothetical protein
MKAGSMVYAGNGMDSPISMSVAFQMLRSALSLAGGKSLNSELPNFGSKARLESARFTTTEEQTCQY